DREGGAGQLDRSRSPVRRIPGRSGAQGRRGGSMRQASGGQGARRPGQGLLSSLGSLAFGLRAAYDSAGLVAAVADHVLDITRADAFALLLLDYETGELEGDRFERGRTGPTGRSRFVATPSGFLGRVLRRETLVVESADAPGAPDIEWSGQPPRTLVGLPVVVGTSLLGVAVVGYRKEVALSDRRRRALLFLSDQIGLAVDRLRTRGELDTTRKQLEESAV